MKNILLFCLISTNLWAISNSDFEYHGYMRAGSGTNSKGGDQECFKNQGSQGNEFRLGNECSHYGEMIFQGNHLNNPSGTSTYFKSQVRLVFESSGHNAYESAAVTQARELFFEGGRFNDSSLTYWVGKRFYREQDVYMNDWYYFAEMGGVGGGIENIKIGEGKLQLAQLKQISTTRTEKGLQGNTFWDARYKGLKLTDKQTLDFWYVYAHGVQSAEFDKAIGHAAGVLHQTKLNDGLNHFAVVYGKGLMQGLNVGGDAVPLKYSSRQQSANRWRIVEHLVTKLSPKWEAHANLSYENRDSGAHQNRFSKWVSAGASPVYFISDNYQIATVIGRSWVKDESDFLGTRSLTRFTIAPQIAPAMSTWARPVLRIFFTKAWWSSNNKSKIAQDAPAYSNDRDGSSFGLQGELWF
jgi:maltoporin